MWRREKFRGHGKGWACSEREKLHYDRGKPHAARAHALRHAQELATEGEEVGGLPGRGKRISKGSGLKVASGLNSAQQHPSEGLLCARQHSALGDVRLSLSAFLSIWLEGLQRRLGPTGDCMPLL